jgi:hypothetical protein
MEIRPTPVLPVDGQNFPAIFPGIFGIFLQYFELIYLFHYISKVLSIYTRISHGTPNNVVRNPCCDPGLLYDVNTFSVSERSHVSGWSDNAYEYRDEGHSSLLTTGWRRIG